MPTQTLDRVLLVDDEPQILSALERQLHKYYRIYNAERAAQALDVLRDEGAFCVVVSDMRMPEMHGAKFLTQVKEIAPFTTRILLTGHADINDAIAAVNDGYIFRYYTDNIKKKHIYESGKLT